MKHIPGTWTGILWSVPVSSYLSSWGWNMAPNHSSEPRTAPTTSTSTTVPACTSSCGWQWHRCDSSGKRSGSCPSRMFPCLEAAELPKSLPVFKGGVLEHLPIDFPILWVDFPINLHFYQWIGLREHFNRKPLYLMGKTWFPVDFPLNQSIDFSWSSHMFLWFSY